MNTIAQSAILREAWEQGWQNGLTQVALNMIRAKIDPDQVATLTGLSIERVNSIYLDIVNPAQSTQLMRDWQNQSESSLAEVWLNDDEDRAWEYL
jgi:hypothetical protein